MSFDSKVTMQSSLAIPAAAGSSVEAFKPVTYPGYVRPMYCSYEEIIRAIESWAKVDAVLMANGGKNHTFIVLLNQSIKLSSSGEGIVASDTTPFELRGIYRWDGSYSDNYILSENQMVFDIRGLMTGSFTAKDIWRSRDLVPDERLSRIEREASLYEPWEDTEKKINSAFSESDKAKKLLEWIRQSGLSILQRGLFTGGRDSIGELRIKTIVANYQRSSCPWEAVIRQ